MITMVIDQLEPVGDNAGEPKTRLHGGGRREEGRGWVVAEEQVVNSKGFPFSRPCRPGTMRDSGAWSVRAGNGLGWG